MSLHLLSRTSLSEKQSKKPLLSTTSVRSNRTAAHPLMQLQQALGNHAVAGLIQTRRLASETGFVIQPKLVVGPAHDHYEQEADATANRVMTMPAPAALESVQRQTMPEEKDKEQTLQTKPLADSITPFVQRQTTPEEEKEKPVQTKPLAASITLCVQREMIPEDDKEEKPVQTKLLTDSGTPTLQREMGSEEEKEKREPPIQAKLSVQRTATGESFDAGEDLEAGLSRSKGGGSPLSNHVRSYMEPRFGADFSGVRVHTDDESVHMNQAVGTQAFTHGQDIYFGTGKGPDISDLTAHELTHVVQQTGGVEPKLQRACAVCAAGGPPCPTCQGEQGKNETTGISRGMVLQRAPAAPPDKELVSSRFVGNATLMEVLNRRATLSSGSSGDAVRLIQEMLLAEGYELPKFGADGKFGNETRKAVREFQARWRLKVDGIVGDQTLGLLDIHDAAKGLLAVGEVLPDFLGGPVKRGAASALDIAEKDRAKSACPPADRAERLTACLQPVIIANDDGTSPTVAPSLALAQRIWEKCCITYSALPAKTVKKSSFKTLDESPTNVPTAEESALFTAAGSSSCIQVFVPENFQQAGVVGKDISGGGATYDAGTTNPKVVVVEGTVPAVVAHEVGHASGHSGHDANDTVMKPSGAHNVANSSKVSSAVCTDARTGGVLSTTSGKDDCCMFPK